jgi:DNA-directed RNA polymerase
MKLNVTAHHFQELISRGFDMNIVVLLRLINEQYDLSALLTESAKMNAMVQGIVRKGLVNEELTKLTKQGQEILVFMDSKVPRRIVKKKVDESEFEKWWKAFPSTNTFTYKGKTFAGDRAMKVKKDECRMKIDKILLEGEFSIDDLVNALNYEVKQKMESSLRAGTNKLSYMHNSLSYLNQNDYIPFIELIRSGNKIIESPNLPSGGGGTDI